MSEEKKIYAKGLELHTNCESLGNAKSFLYPRYTMVRIDFGDWHLTSKATKEEVIIPSGNVRAAKLMKDPPALGTAPVTTLKTGRKPAA